MKYISIGAVWLIIASALVSCSAEDSRQVVVYTSVDRHLAQPVLAEFEAQTGIKVLGVFDSEANKTVGLYERLRVEKDKPRADIFWNSEIIHTRLLAQSGALSKIKSHLQKESGSSLASEFWVPVGLRARTLLLHNDALDATKEEWNLDLLANNRFKGKAGFANPQFGTTKTHFSYLHYLWGPEKFKSWLLAMKKNQVMLLPGNAQVRDYVARGTLLIGLTDTDDAIGAIRRGQPVTMFLPSVESKFDHPTIVMPTTAGLTAPPPNPLEAEEFIAFLQSKNAAKILATGSGGFLTHYKFEIEHRKSIPHLTNIKVDDVNWDKVTGNSQTMLNLFNEVWFAPN